MASKFLYKVKNDLNSFSHEYDIINAVVRVSYKLPEDFPIVIRDLIQQVVVCISV
jgi:hypothetical protein